MTSIGYPVIQALLNPSIVVIINLKFLMLRCPWLDNAESPGVRTMDTSHGNVVPVKYNTMSL